MNKTVVRVFAVVILCSATVLGIVYSMTPVTYESRAVVYVKYVGTNSPAVVDTEVNILRSHSLVEIAGKSVGLPTHEVQQALRVARREGKRAQTIDLSFTHSDPDVTTHVLSSLLVSWQEAHGRQSAATEERFQEELDRAQWRLAKGEIDEAEFRRIQEAYEARRMEVLENELGFEILQLPSAPVGSRRLF